MVEAGESEYSGLLKTRNLLIFRDAKNAENCQIAPNWNVSGTRDFQFYSPIFVEFPRSEKDLKPLSRPARWPRHDAKVARRPSAQRDR
jgi:hypothetical protein